MTHAVTHAPGPVERKNLARAIIQTVTMGPGSNAALVEAVKAKLPKSPAERRASWRKAHPDQHAAQQRAARTRKTT